MDGDGDLDAFIANSGPDEVWFNDGTGHFGNSGQSLGTGGSSDVALGDFDGDGDLDAVTGEGRVWINNGSGFFSGNGQVFGYGFQGVALGDIDGDLDLDVFFVEGHDPYTILTNDGNGQFTLLATVGGGTGTRAESVMLGDLDDDGDLDAFVAHGTNDPVTGYGLPNEVWFNDGTGEFTDSGQSLVLCQPSRLGFC